MYVPGASGFMAASFYQWPTIMTKVAEGLTRQAAAFVTRPRAAQTDAGFMLVYGWRHCIRHLSANDGSMDEKSDLLVACETTCCSIAGSERHRREARSRSISAWRRLLQHPFPNHGDSHERMTSGPHIRIPLFLSRAPSRTIMV